MSELHMQKLAGRRGWHITEVRGEPITTWSRQITPIGRVFQLNWLNGAFVWQRPVAIEVRQRDTVQRLPIRDHTLRAITIIIFTGMAIAIGVSPLVQWVRSRRRRKN
jgi:hypothetical protein